ncbi:1-acyl-sn-glycerol-3-phosphate acyltransferase [Oscillospiraceae bacterium CM]|nr:1-acyl-sn-glycerol-3-phosphate acyltransferase [Oscillospiraceae bacterium CM]
MNKEFRAYRWLYIILRLFLFPFYWLRFRGRENVPKGAAVFCANHTSNLDPIFVGFAAGINNHLHMMGKKELFDVPILSAFYRAAGSFPVDRSISDVGAIRKTLKYLKEGEKMLIFPEGQRVRGDEKVEAKLGAVKMADQMNVPVVPVYIPSGKRIFHRYTIVIGVPYLVNPERKKLSNDAYVRLADDMMEKIAHLRQ